MKQLILSALIAMVALNAKAQEVSLLDPSTWFTGRAEDSTPVARLKYMEDAGGTLQARIYTIRADGLIGSKFGMRVGPKKVLINMDGHSTRSIDSQTLLQTKVIAAIVKAPSLVQTELETDCTRYHDGEYSVFADGKEVKVASIHGCQRLLPTNKYERNAALNLIDDIAQAVDEMDWRL